MGPLWIVWAFLKRIPWQVWAGLLVLALLVGIHHAGVVSGRAQVRAKFDKHLSADRAAEAIAKQRAKLKEDHDREAFAAIARTFEKDKADAVAKERAVADGLRRGALRLRKQWRCEASDSASTPAGPEAADGDTALRERDTGRLVGIGARADAWIKALQAVLQAEREKPIQP